MQKIFTNPLLLLSLFSLSSSAIDPVTVLAMGSLPKEQIVKMIAQTNFARNESDLISYLGSKIINGATNKLVIDPKDPKQIASLFLTTSINLFSARNAALEVGWSEAWDEDPWSTALNAADLAMTGILEDIWHQPWRDDFDDARTLASGAAQRAVASALEIVNPQDNEEREEITCRLAKLYVLAFMGQNEFIENHFIKPYERTYDFLLNNSEFHPELDDVVITIKNATWGKAELANNALIQFLEAIFSRYFQ